MSRQVLHACKDPTDNVLIVNSGRDLPFLHRRLQDLAIDQLWIRGYESEKALAPIFNKFISSTSYKNYYISSDDNYISYENFNKLQKVLSVEQNRIVSSYCAPYQDKKQLSFCPSVPVWTGSAGLFGTTEPHRQYADIKEFLRSGNELTECYFNGWFFCGVRREIWMKYPYFYSVGGGDFPWAEEVIHSGEKMIVVKDAPCLHFCSYQARELEGHSFSGRRRSSKSIVFKSFNESLLTKKYSPEDRFRSGRPGRHWKSLKFSKETGSFEILHNVKAELATY